MSLIFIQLVTLLEVVKCSLEKTKTTLDELGMKELLVKPEKWKF